MNIKLKKSFLQISFILFLSIFIGIFINIIQPDSIPLIRNNKDENIISLMDAKKKFLEKKAVFMDARSSQDYETGHIKGANNLPASEIGEKFIQVTEKISKEQLIITYCDGEACHLSKELALFLKDMGYTNVKVFINGLTLWKGEKLPIEKS